MGMTTVKQQRKGAIVSKPSDTMAVVECVRFVRHPKYRKFFKRSKKYHAADPANAYRAGDIVIMEAARPISKTKRWRIVKKIS